MVVAALVAICVLLGIAELIMLIRLAGDGHLLMSWLRAAWNWVQDNRLVAVVLGLFLIAVPTVATLLPVYVLHTDRIRRVSVLVVWILGAAIVTIATQVHESEATQRELAIQRTTVALHESLVRGRLRLILDPAQSSIPASYTSSVYLDSGNKTLLPWYPELVSDPNDFRVFAHGNGATGKAFVTKNVKIVVGPAVSNSEHGLTPKQMDEFAGYSVVVAVPIRAPGDRIIGVLTLIAVENDGYFCSPTGQPVDAAIAGLNRTAREVTGALDGIRPLGWRA